MTSKKVSLHAILLCGVLFDLGCDSKLETAECSENYANCTLRWQITHKQGDVFGRGKSFRQGDKTLWHSGKLILGNVHAVELARDDRWGFITVLDAEGKLTHELHLVDMQEGVTQRTVSYPGWTWDRVWDPAGLRLAVGVNDPAGPNRLLLDVFDTTAPGISQRTIYSGTEDLVQFPHYAWSPDSSSIAFVIIVRGMPDRHEFVHLRVSNGKSDLVTRVRCSGGGEVDWTDTQRPVLK